MASPIKKRYDTFFDKLHRIWPAMPPDLRQQLHADGGEGGLRGTGLNDIFDDKEYVCILSECSGSSLKMNPQEMYVFIVENNKDR